MSFVTAKSKFKNGASVSDGIALFRQSFVGYI